MIDQINEIKQRLQMSQHVVVLTGAGISAESGIPTFREAQTGLWARYDPQELATRYAFARNPKLVWDWYAWRRELVGQAQPNPGHYALAAWARQVPRLTLITQNIDNLHQQAGSQNVIELHGNLTQFKCFDRDHRVDPAAWLPAADGPPTCPHCGSLMRPNVVWFGESLPEAGLAASLQAVRAADLFFSVGTSTTVEPAASLPFLAAENRVTTIEVNPQPTPFTPAADFVLAGPAGEILPQLSIK